MENQIEGELKQLVEQDGKPLRLTKTVEICGFCGKELDKPTVCYICGELVCPGCEGKFGIKPPDQQKKELQTAMDAVDKINQFTLTAMATMLDCVYGMEIKDICRSCFPAFLVELDKAIQNTKNIVEEGRSRQGE